MWNYLEIKLVMSETLSQVVQQSKTSVYAFMSMCLCVCMCVWRDRETESKCGQKNGKSM